jgi:hypothetical protein
MVLVKRHERKLFPGPEKRAHSEAEKDFALKRHGSRISVREQGSRRTVFGFGRLPQPLKMPWNQEPG